jgi:predicted nucleic acid-binding protein
MALTAQRMTPRLHLDTNVLIFATDPSHPAYRRLQEWLETGETIAVSAMAWAEFRCGPLTAELLQAWEGLLGGRVIAMDRTVAERASDLFNLTGRRSRSLPDCLVAAAAICDNARLATLNRADFGPMQPFGLRLAD